MSSSALSPRLQAVIEALPLRPAMRVLEIGGAPGAAARRVVERVGPHGHVLVVDRSVTGIAATERACRDQIDAGLMSVLCASVESFTLPPGCPPFDLAFACRVGVLDGRHPREYEQAIARVSAALVPGASLYVDTGDPLTRIALAESRLGEAPPLE